MGGTPHLYDTLLLLCGGASICIALLAIVVGLRIGDRKKWLLLAAMGGLEGLYCVFLFYYFAAPDVDSSIFWSGGFCIFMPFMTYIYVALSHHILQKVPRWFQPFPVIALAGSIIFAMFMTSDLLLGTHIVLQELQINQGSLHRKLMLFNVFGQAWFGLVNVLYYTSAFLLILDYVRGNRNMLPIVAGTVCYFLALSSDFNILFRLYDFYFIQHFGFLAMVIGFNFYFASDYIRSVQELREAHSELRSHRERMIQDEKLKLLGKMSTFISHEINSPLNVITVCSDFCLEKIDEAPQLRKYIEKTRDAASRIQKIIKGLSGFARNDAREFPETQNLRRIIGEAVEFSAYRDTGVRIPVEVDVPEDIELECYPTQVTQCLVNLLTNSIDALQGQKESWIRIEAGMLGDSVRISVTDSGPAISEANARKIMQPFYTTKARESGTGLGLAIVLMLVERHGGSFLIDSSAPNACFRITLNAKLTPSRIRNIVV